MNLKCKIFGHKWKIHTTLQSMASVKMCKRCKEIDSFALKDSSQSRIHVIDQTGTDPVNEYWIPLDEFLCEHKNLKYPMGTGINRCKDCGKFVKVTPKYRYGIDIAYGVKTTATIRPNKDGSYTLIDISQKKVENDFNPTGLADNYEDIYDPKIVKAIKGICPVCGVKYPTGIEILEGTATYCEYYRKILDEKDIEDYDW